MDNIIGFIIGFLIVIIIGLIIALKESSHAQKNTQRLRREDQLRKRLSENKKEYRVKATLKNGYYIYSSYFYSELIWKEGYVDDVLWSLEKAQEYIKFAFLDQSFRDDLGKEYNMKEILCLEVVEEVVE